MESDQFIGLVTMSNFFAIHIYENLFSYFSPSTILFNGTKYKVGAMVYVGQSDGLPEFAVIQGIFVLDTDKIYFIVKRFKTIK